MTGLSSRRPHPILARRRGDGGGAVRRARYGNFLRAGAKAGAAAAFSGVSNVPCSHHAIKTPRATQKVIPFEQLQRHAAGKAAAPSQAEGTSRNASDGKPATQSRAPQRKATPPVGQGNLDFVRVLHWVNAFWPPAYRRRFTAMARGPAMRRLTAGVWTWRWCSSVSALLQVACALLDRIRRIHGSGFGAGKRLDHAVPVADPHFAFYGLVWALAKRETAE